MARQKAEGGRYFVRLSEEEKRMLDFLTVDAGYGSSEAYGGKLLGDLLRERWATFKPSLRKPDLAADDKPAGTEPPGGKTRRR